MDSAADTSLRSGLPHSEILGSKPARGSPRLFAACHVLHRLLAPRHPPDALAFLVPRQRQPSHARPTRARSRRAHRCRRSAASTDDSSDNCSYKCRPPVVPRQPAARIPMPDTRPACRRKEHRTRMHAATCRCHDVQRIALQDRWIGLTPPMPRNGHLVTTSRCPSSNDLAATGRRTPAHRQMRLVGLGRLERPTSRLSGVRSNQLSYRPKSRQTRSRTARRQSRRPRPRPTVAGEGTCRRRRASYPRRSIKTALDPTCMPGACTRRWGPRRSRRARRREVPPDADFWGAFRKEVIQPQVPLRLPCYDFTPVADPTVDACLPCGLAQRLRVEPTPMV